MCFAGTTAESSDKFLTGRDTENIIRQILLSRGKDVKGSTALLRAAYDEDWGKVKNLFFGGLLLIVKGTPPAYAAYYGSKELAQ